MKKLKQLAIILTLLIAILAFPTTTFAASKPTPGKVTLSKISSPAYNKITINWKKTSNATNYVVYYKKSSTSKWTKLTTLSSSKTSYTHTSSTKYPIVVGQKYNYTIKAYNSKSKKYGSYNTKGLTTNTKPSTVTLSKVTLNSSKTQATITWKKASGCDTYMVYRKTGSSDWKKIASVKSSVLKYTDKSPVKGTKNSYTIKSYYSKTKVYGNYNKTGLSVTVPTVKVTKVTLNKTSASLTKKGATVQLSVTISPSNAANKAVTWKSSNTKVATVNSSGKVTAVSNGTATITATAKDGSKKSASCKVTVKVPSHTHKYTSKITKEATCGTDGVKTFTCSCGDSYTESIPKTGKHSYTSKITKEATCGTDGVKTFTCSVCKDSYTESIPKTNKHNYTEEIIRPATCIDDGVKKYTCTVCGTSRLASMSATTKNHAWESKTKEATCTEDGYTCEQCSLCHEERNKEIIPATGHQYDEGVVTTEPTTESEGVKTYTCSVCGETKTESIEKLPAPDPTPYVENITLAGGDTDLIGPDISEFTSINFKEVTFEYQNTEGILEITGLQSNQYSASVGIKGLQQGTATITAKYNDEPIKQWTIEVTSPWSEYEGYVNWRKDVESQIWTDDMTVVEKLDAAKEYIQTNFQYSYTNAAIAVYSYQTKKINCISASEIFGDFAKDLNLRVGYINVNSGQIYDYLNDAVGAAGSHIGNAIFLNNEWVPYDAQPSISTAVD